MSKKICAVGRGVGGFLVLVMGAAGVGAVGSAGLVPVRWFCWGAVAWGLFSALVAWGVLRMGRGRVVRNILAALGVVIIGVVSFAAIRSALVVNTLIAAVQEPEGEVVVETRKGEVSKPFVLYISGIDVRSHSLPLKARSDVNILVVVNPEMHKVLTVNTPRDYYVELASYGAMDKLTHAGVYGVEESVKTLANLYATEIDYYARVNFDTLVQVVDTIGGIEVDSDYDFSIEGHHFTVGRNSLDGARALAFSRERKSFAGGDRVRGEHQQMVIGAIFQKMLQPNMLWQADSILEVLANSLQTNLGVENVRSLVQEQLSEGADWEVENMAVDGTGKTTTTYSLGSLPQYVMVPRWETVEAARGKVAGMLGR